MKKKSIDIEENVLVLLRETKEYLHRKNVIANYSDIIEALYQLSKTLGAGEWSILCALRAKRQSLGGEAEREEIKTVWDIVGEE